MYIGGLDIGTSGCKITIYDECGNYIENHYKEYSSLHKGCEHEIDANDIIKAVETVIMKTNNKPAFLGVTSFGETFVLVGEDDRVLCNSMLYTDNRGDDESKLFDSSIVKNIAYCSPHGMYTIPKLMWVKNNRPEIFKKVKYIFLIQDFVMYMLTGNRCIDYSLAARTMGFDIVRKEWSKEIFAFAGIDTSLMSEPVPSGSIVGKTNKFGLYNTTVIAGCHDQVASAIGAGALSENIAVDGSGSVECITPVLSSLPNNNDICDSGFAFVPFIDDKYVCYAFSFTGGTALKWFKDNFTADESYAELDIEADGKIGTILTMPHFSGAATPYMDIDSKALFYGITLDTKKIDLYRSIMEGVAYEMKINIDHLSKYNINIDKMLATGGGSKSGVWLQIKADICNVPITVINAEEVGALGTIMLAACTAGICKNIEESKKIFVNEGKTYYPNKINVNKYEKLYEQYKNIYSSTIKWRCN